MKPFTEPVYIAYSIAASSKSAAKPINVNFLLPAVFFTKAVHLAVIGAENEHKTAYRSENARVECDSISLSQIMTTT